METVPIRMDRRWLTQFQERLETDQGWSDPEGFELALEAAKAQQIPDFDSLRCQAFLQGFTPLPHQLETARRVLGRCTAGRFWPMKSDWVKPSKLD